MTIDAFREKVHKLRVLMGGRYWQSVDDIEWKYVLRINECSDTRYMTKQNMIEMNRLYRKYLKVKAEEEKKSSA